MQPRPRQQLTMLRRGVLATGLGSRLPGVAGDCPLFESLDDGQPAFSCCGDLQERRQPPAKTALLRQNIEPRRIGRIRGPSEEPGGDQDLECLVHLREVIPDVRGQTLTDQEGPWMPVEKQQQVELAWAPQVPDRALTVDRLIGGDAIVATNNTPISGGEQVAMAHATGASSLALRIRPGTSVARASRRKSRMSAPASSRCTSAATRSARSAEQARPAPS